MFQIRDTPDFLFETGYRIQPSDGNASTGSGAASGKSYPGAYKFGGVYNGGKFSDRVGRRNNSNYLIYGMASQAVFRSDAGSDRGFDAGTSGCSYAIVPVLGPLIGGGLAGILLRVIVK